MDYDDNDPFQLVNLKIVIVKSPISLKLYFFLNLNLKINF